MGSLTSTGLDLPTLGEVAAKVRGLRRFRRGKSACRTSPWTWEKVAW